MILNCSFLCTETVGEVIRARMKKAATMMSIGGGKHPEASFIQP